MRTAVAWLISMALLAGVAAPVGAEPAPKKHKRHASQAARPGLARRVETPPRPDKFIERDASKIPFGTSAWWEQMLRENRLTCCN